MKLSEFDFNLPDELIAQYPTENRHDSRLMVVHRKTGLIEHKKFTDILNYFEDGDSMIINNTKVFAARLYGRKEKTNAEIEVFMLRELNAKERLWDVLVEPARKIRVGNKLYFNTDKIQTDLVAEVIDNTTSRGRTIRFIFPGDDEAFKAELARLGQAPLPRYIKRPVEDLDYERYQTVFAKEVGAVAAPTAGLHFSKELMKRLEIKGINFAEVTLHVGLGTFRRIEVEDLSKHKMEAEYFKIPEKAAAIVNKSKETGHKVCAIGTTSMRTSESSVSAQNLLKPAEGWTNLFIHPPYDFHIADCLLTNFHLPKTSLLILVVTYAGYDLMMKA